jgi:crossover junction endodeoxyribonuclease RuvC
LNTGWGLIQRVSRPELVDCGVIRLRNKGEFAERLASLQRQLEEIVARVHPDAAAVEAPFHGASARAALQLAHSRGVILAVLAGAGVPVAEWSPASVKKAIADNGRADKDQVRKMVCLQLNIEPDRPHDLTDALAVALCHMHSSRFLSAVERAVGRR